MCAVVRYHGFSLIELMTGLAVGGLVLMIAIPSYINYINQSKVSQAIGCMWQIEGELERYRTRYNSFPDLLAAVQLGDCQNDPWDNPFQYLKIEGKKGKGGNRKDRSENPLNSDYDLYSMGKDGKTNQSLRPKVSHDDIIRAKNGAYIGAAADY